MGLLSKLKCIKKLVIIFVMTNKKVSIIYHKKNRNIARNIENTPEIIFKIFKAYF